ncbi:hypothetical protein [Stratiformator vulcanicus]|uniref:TIR domain-containing protein n=1 Tax=Stratiformator vulcanicus TaxID=2527980 RepID=A0A517QWM1_9PLAN|nr:hypothetical protein [Stratiformator vulcanicus]QDT35970.1 hypothetical protein Pan189_03250 [Stratiformator vulcanicus]
MKKFDDSQVQDAQHEAAVLEADRFDGFISYSQRADSALATALQYSLTRFGKKWYRRRALRLFRDFTSLSATPELWPLLRRNLASSEYFILIASKAASESPWVAREAEFWCEHRKSQNVLIVLSDGEIGWDGAKQDFDWNKTNSLPNTFQNVFEHEPLFIDLRWVESEEDRSLKHPKFADAVATLAAAIHKVPKDELIGTDVREHRRFKVAATLSLCMIGILFIGMLATGAFSYVQNQVAASRTEAAIKSIGDQGESLIDTLNAINTAGLQPNAETNSLRTQVISDAISRMKSITNDLQKSPESLRRLVDAYIVIAENLRDIGAIDNSAQLFEIIIVICEELTSTSDSRGEDRIQMAFVLNNYGRVLSQNARHEDAIKAYEASVKACKFAAKNNEVATMQKRQRSVALGNLARLKRSFLPRSNWDELLTEAYTLENELASLHDHPMRSWFLLNLASTEMALSEIANADNEVQEEPVARLFRALSHVETAIEIHDPDSNPALWNFYRKAGSIRLAIARIQLSDSEYRSARVLAVTGIKNLNTGMQLYAEEHSPFTNVQILSHLVHAHELMLSIEQSAAKHPTMEQLESWIRWIDVAIEEFGPHLDDESCRRLRQKTFDLVSQIRDRAPSNRNTAWGVAKRLAIDMPRDPRILELFGIITLELFADGPNASPDRLWTFCDSAESFLGTSHTAGTSQNHRERLLELLRNAYFSLQQLGYETERVITRLSELAIDATIRYPDNNQIFVEAILATRDLALIREPAAGLNALDEAISRIETLHNPHAAQRARLAGLHLAHLRQEKALGLLFRQKLSLACNEIITARRLVDNILETDVDAETFEIIGRIRRQAAVAELLRFARHEFEEWFRAFPS